MDSYKAFARMMAVAYLLLPYLFLRLVLEEPVKVVLEAYFLLVVLSAISFALVKLADRHTANLVSKVASIFVIKDGVLSNDPGFLVLSIFLFLTLWFYGWLIVWSLAQVIGLIKSTTEDLLSKVFKLKIKKKESKFSPTSGTSYQGFLP